MGAGEETEIGEGAGVVAGAGARTRSRAGRSELSRTQEKVMKYDIVVVRW